MLDAGLLLEPSRRTQVASLQSMPSTSWPEKSVAFLRDGGDATRDGIPMKPAYGSDFAYRDPIGQGITSDGAYGMPSFARGGFSNVWGAAPLPHPTEEMRRCPITPRGPAPPTPPGWGLLPVAGRAAGSAALLPLSPPQ